MALYKTRQLLANYSQQSVRDLSVSRLEKLYAPVVAQRRQADLDNEQAFEMNIPHIEHVKRLLAQELEQMATEENAHLPISGVFEALQVVKQSKVSENDIGVRALETMLTSMWRKDRTASITSAKFTALTDHFRKNYPRSAVCEVLEKIGESGYLSLEVSKLAALAQDISSQEDYERVILENGLQSNTPNCKKARQFILALVNGDDERPFERMPEEEEFEKGNLNTETFYDMTLDHHQGEQISLNDAISKTWGEFCDLNNSENLGLTFDELAEMRDAATEMFFSEKKAQSDEEDFDEEEDFSNEPEEGDYVIQDDGAWVVGSHGRTHLGDGSSERWEIYDLIDEDMKKHNFYPNVWTLSDHGNLNLINFGEELEKQGPKPTPEPEDDYDDEEDSVTASKKTADFMQPQVEFGTWIVVDTDQGGSVIPADLVDMDEVKELQERWMNGEKKIQLSETNIGQYLEGRELYDIDVKEGFGARLSAPGYMDSTDWDVFDTQEEAESYLKEQYGDDEFDEDPDEDLV